MSNTEVEWRANFGQGTKVPADSEDDARRILYEWKRDDDGWVECRKVTVTPLKRLP